MQRDRHTVGDIERQIDRQTRQRDRQTEIWTETEAYTEIHGDLQTLTRYCIVTCSSNYI